MTPSGKATAKDVEVSMGNVNDLGVGNATRGGCRVAVVRVVGDLNAGKGMTR